MTLLCEPRKWRVCLNHLTPACTIKSYEHTLMLSVQPHLYIIAQRYDRELTVSPLYWQVTCSSVQKPQLLHASRGNCKPCVWRDLQITTFNPQLIANLNHYRVYNVGYHFSFHSNVTEPGVRNNVMQEYTKFLKANGIEGIRGKSRSERREGSRVDVRQTLWGILYGVTASQEGVVCRHEHLCNTKMLAQWHHYTPAHGAHLLST